MAWIDVDHFAFESRAERRQRQLSSFRQLADKVRPLVGQGQVGIAQARHAVQEAQPKKSPYETALGDRMRERLARYDIERTTGSRLTSKVEPWEKKKDGGFLGDLQDAGRGAAPMVQADDAVLLDTTDMDIETAFDAARRIVEAARVRNGLQGP